MIDPQSIQKAKGADLLALIGSSTRLKHVSATEGGEYAGPCPMCGGKDRFHVQPARGRWLCRHYTGKWKEAIALHRALNHSSFDEAVRDLCGGERAHTPLAARYQIARVVEDAPEANQPPVPAWQNRARDMIAEAQRNLWSCEPGASEVRRWLDRQRALSRSLLKLWQIGRLPQPLREPAERWGLPADDEAVYISAGVLIPCVVAHAVRYGPRLA